ncbi:MAG: hypothetical protein LAQ69_20850 [Acidobacteriia bacterium]|nr:hypothetical protein [Terriglobia bacterium]
MADIQTLINAIPDAQDGDVITANSHNSIKQALIAIAGQLGGTTGNVTQTIQPAFLPIPPNPTWNVSLGLAADQGPPGADGFIPLNLPDGAVIQQMVAMGAKINSAPKGFANLLILPIGSGGTGSSTLIQIDLTNAGAPFTLTGTPSTSNIPGVTAAGLKQMQTVQNSQFKYVIETKILSPAGTPVASVTINAFQVIYSKS